MNTKLLLKVKAKILAEPAQFVMVEMFTSRILTGGSDRRDRLPFEYDLPRKIPNCGTAACIAGWAISIHDAMKPGDSRWDLANSLFRAARLLDLDDAFAFNPMTSADRLFYVDRWPKDAQARWGEATTLQERAEIAAEVIDRFIANDGEPWAQEKREGAR